MLWLGAAGASAQTALPALEQQALRQAPAWAQCLPLPDAPRLRCFDQWAQDQQALQAQLQAREQALAQSPHAAPAPVSDVRRQVASALAAAEPAPTPPDAPPGPSGVLAVGLEQGCRDRQYSSLSRFWELEAGASCPAMTLRGFRPSSIGVAYSSRVNRQPQSENPLNSSAAATDYQKHDARLSVSVRTKLASGLLTPAGGPLRDSLWFGYSLNAHWQVFNHALSRPFRNTDHMPELIYIYPSAARLPGGWLLRYTGLGLAHQSNGQSDPLSRSWNRLYAAAGLESASGRWNAQVRLWHRLREDDSKDNNPRITHYLGRGDVLLGWQLDSRNQLSLLRTGFHRRGHTQLSWTHALPTRPGGPSSGLKLYASVFHGYGDSLLDYNFKRSVFSVGLRLDDF